MDRYDRNDDYRRDRYDRDNDRDGGYRSGRDRHPRDYDDEATDYPSSGRSRGGYRDNDDYDRDRSYRGRSYRDDDSYGDDYQGGRRRTRYDRDDDRGFFDRVGGWFDGDDDDYRRSGRGRYGSGGGYGRDHDDDDDYYDERRSHRGRGPKNYNRSDDRIRDDVNDALTDDHYLDASDISVTAKSGEVTLDGHVYGRRAKRRAEDLAEKASGVRHVQNNLRVRDLDDVDNDDDVKTYPDDPDATNRATTGSNTRKKAKT